MTLLDFILIGIMVISGLLAMMRGLTREVLTLLAWVLAAIAAYYALKQAKLIEMVLPYVEKPLIAQIAVGAGAFLLTLIIISLISVKISDAVVDSAAGAFDRSLGFLFGVARGFLLVAIAYLFYGWLLPADKQDAWVRNAASLPAIKATGDTLLDFLPPDIADALRNTALATNPPASPTGAPIMGGASAGDTTEKGYQPNDTQGMDNLVGGAGETAPSQPAGDNKQKPAFGQSDGQ